MDNLQIIHWNCKSIKNNIKKPYALLVKIIADIMVLTEANLNPLKIIKVSNYHTYRYINAITNGISFGGTALLVH